MSSENNEKPRFEFLDRSSQIEITEGNLPHWFQPGTALFVTFRTHDSLPKKVVEQSQIEVRQWLINNQLSPNLADQPNNAAQMQALRSRIDSLHADQRNQLRTLRIRLWQQNLDDCHGACFLKDKSVSSIVSDALLSLNGERYDLDCFVIMPNHVHAIVQFKNGYDQTMIGQSWLRYTAGKINKKLGLRGPFWQSEPFDHLVRNEAQFSYFQQYIKDNPTNAHLSSNEYTYWTQ